MTALVLSVLILWIASMFQSINSMEVFSYYRYISGHNYLSNDFVYLYGGLHSIILVIFVLPAKFKIMDINTSFPELQTPAGTADTTLTGILKGTGKTLTEVLIVSSPLLTSLLQNLLNTFFS